MRIPIRTMLVAAALAASGLAWATDAFSHHSFAMFDNTRRLEVSGVVKEFQYTNPHSWLIVTAPGPGGKMVDWAFESEGPSTLLQMGIKRSSLPPGEKVKVVCMPMRDGRPAGALLRVTRADGTLIDFRPGRP